MENQFQEDAMNRLCLFVLLMAAFCLAAPEPADAKFHRGGQFGKKIGKMGRMKKGDAESDNPMDPGASRELHEKTRLIKIGLTPVYPDAGLSRHRRLPGGEIPLRQPDPV